MKVAPSREHGGHCFLFRVAGRNTTNASLNVSPIPDRKEDLGKIINTIQHAMGL